MNKFFIPLILLAFYMPAYAGTIYKWVDEKGVVNFTNEYNNIPPQYVGRVQREVVEDFPEAKPLVSPPTPLQKSETMEADLYGRDETWWKEKVGLWKEKLREATENYEKAQKIFTKKAEALSQTNFYGRSRSQTKWDVMELGRLEEEKKKYEAQVTEASEMLNKLSQEAEEAKADPSWLE